MHTYAHTHIAHSGVFFGAYIRTAVRLICCYDHPVFFCCSPVGRVRDREMDFDEF